MIRQLSFVFAGALFAAGLAVSGMTDPARVLAFLDVGGRWDPSLALVMVGAIGVYAVASAFSKRLRRPFAASRFHPTNQRHTTPRLVVGSLVFGVGWGLVGYCPGPAIVSTATGASSVLYFTLAMVVTFGVTRKLLGRLDDGADDAGEAVDALEPAVTMVPAAAPVGLGTAAQAATSTSTTRTPSGASRRPSSGQ